MSAADSVPQTPAPADPKLYEPSMEEILASIRRIIADDQSLPGRLAVGEEEGRLRAILTPSEAPPPAAPPEPEPTPTVRAIFAPHPVAPEPVIPRPAAPQPIEAPRPAAATPRIAAPQPPSARGSHHRRSAPGGANVFVVPSAADRDRRRTAARRRPDPASPGR